MEKYFDYWDFKNNEELIESDPRRAKEEFEEYIRQNPEDYSGRLCYVYCLIILGEFEKADDVLKRIEETAQKNEKFMRASSKVRDLKFSLMLNKLKLLAYQEKYQELYNFCENHLKEVKEADLMVMYFYSKCKIGKMDVKRRNEQTYLFRQMMDYKEDDFINHIQKHLADYNRSFIEPNNYVFGPDFPLKKVLEEIKKYIPSNDKFCFGFVDDIYVFKFDECGRCKNKLTNYFKVVCLHNTFNIITMCPTENGEKLCSIDLNYMVEKKETTTIKRESAIEKFNRRYKRN